MLQSNVSLQPYNTFGIAANARYFAVIDSLATLRAALADPAVQGLPLLVLGGGSNLLFTRDFDGLVLQMRLSGKRVLQDDGDSVLVQAMAGENWHSFVMWTLQQDWQGLENMALIPGTVGAAPNASTGNMTVAASHPTVAMQARSMGHRPGISGPRRVRRPRWVRDRCWRGGSVPSRRARHRKA